MALLIIGIFLCGVVSAWIFDVKMSDINREDMKTLTKLLAATYDHTNDPQEETLHLSKLAGGVRVTLIDSDGTVIGDSWGDINSMENHLNRAEIKNIRGDSVESSVRNSETIGYHMVYTAIKMEGGNFLRISKEYKGFLPNILSFLPAILIAVLVAFCIAVLLAGRFSKKMAEPIQSFSQKLAGAEDGSLFIEPAIYPYEELQDMARSINQLSLQIQTHLGEVTREKDKIQYILNNMEEGFILLDKMESILMINNRACGIFGCSQKVVGKGILNAVRDISLADRINQAFEKKESVTIDIEKENRFIQIGMYMVKEEEELGGMMIILSDLTDSRNAAKIRREFFSNASHELKTPITSIKGFAEMLNSNMVVDEGQRKEFIDRIAIETERMNRLINDMVMISKMESETSSEEEWKEIDCAEIVQECVHEMMPLAKKNEVEISCDLQKSIMHMAEKDFYSLIENLLSNAVNYNRREGIVKVFLHSENEKVILIVYNEGEPIPSEKQERIFERFYRVDQGRSKNVGGTGLGLAIVKHVVERYRGSISLKSDESGTTFTIILPQNIG